jgi:hypothetical protein
MDALSDVLRLVCLGGAVYLNGDFTAPWCVVGAVTAELCTAFLPRAERIVSYHLITEGSCCVRLVDDPASTIRVHAGELLVVPQGEARLIGSTLELAPAPSDEMLARYLETAPGEVMKLSYGGGAHTRLI